MLSTKHTNTLVDSGKTNRETNELIRKQEIIVDYNKTMGGIDLVSRVVIPYNLQTRRFKWPQKLAELFLELSVYNSFIIFKKLNPDNNTMTHLLFRQALIEELIQFHSYGSKPTQTGPVGIDANPLRLVERHFIHTLPATQNKARAQLKCLRCSKLGTRRQTRF